MSYVTNSKLGDMGRLGNQFLQIATTIGYGIRNDKTPVFPESWKYKEFIDLEYKDILTDSTVSEAWLRYTELPYKTGNVDTHGHFLSTKYFNTEEKEVLNAIKLKDKHSQLVDKLSINIKNKCSIHVRRGDYLLPEQMNCQGVMGMDYYNKAIELMPKDTEFAVFSDDITWCKENFIGGKYTFIEGNEDIIDLFLMSKCSSNIISNSTFSWWSAYLNDKANKVIAPIQWFRATKGWEDLYKQNWITI